MLAVKDLKTHFFTRAGVVHAVDGVSLEISPGKTLALVGESGSGKSVTGLSIMRLVMPPGRIVSGEITFDGRNLLDLTDEEMRRVRGREIAMIFQDPMTSLNPVFTVGGQIAEAGQLHLGLTRKQSHRKAIEMMERVRIPDSERRARDYPHQLSGGMRQRVMIAMALSCGPKLLIADEPTTALDVTIQAEILDLLATLRDEFRLAMLLITHDLGVVAGAADSVAVMYAGQIVEESPVRELFHSPQHPYTEGLLESVPRLNSAGISRRLHTIQRAVPSLINPARACRFSPRCSYVISECELDSVALTEFAAAHKSRCIRFDQVGLATSRTRRAEELEAHS